MRAPSAYASLIDGIGLPGLRAEAERIAGELARSGASSSAGRTRIRSTST